MSDAPNPAPIIVKVGRALKHEDFQDLVNILKIQVENFTNERGLGAMHMAVLATHLAPAPDSENTGMLGTQSAVMEIHSQGELQHTVAGESMVGATAALALKWAGNALNHAETAVVETAEAAPPAGWSIN